MPVNSNMQDLFSAFLKCKSVCTDTRKIKRGDIFFALKGPNFDGNEYIETALAKGASLAVSDSLYYAKKKDVLVFSDSLVALQDLARLYRSKLDCTVIGLTGSNGKTTTKELCYRVLASHFDTFCTQGNLNNHIGVPLTILSSPDNIEFLIIEMGANSQGEIDFLSEIAKPDFGLITNIGKAHLEGFGGIDGVIKGKTELYRYLEKSGGKAFMDLNNKVLLNNAPALMEIIGYHPYQVIDCKKSIKIGIDNTIYESLMYGQYNVENIVAAISMGLYFNVPQDKIHKAIAEYNPDNNRSTVKKMGKHMVFFDAYNANPSSVKSSLEGFEQAVEGRKIVILGDMLELGSESLTEHHEIIKIVESMDVDNSYYIGEIYKSLTPENAFNSVEDFKRGINIQGLDPSNILIKGSRKVGLEEIFRD